jgi:hypothetical protein
MSRVSDSVANYLGASDSLELLCIISSWRFTDEGLQRLRPWPRLKELQLIRTGVTEEGVRQLQERSRS